ncbi:MAG: hypothetical protein HQL35_14665 [Alphaproteobacteria bacterium]|nr:hypothetical protein [Alphaproteobacteria bacterium]
MPETKTESPVAQHYASAPPVKKGFLSEPGYIAVAVLAIMAVYGFLQQSGESTPAPIVQSEQAAPAAAPTAMPAAPAPATADGAVSDMKAALPNDAPHTYGFPYGGPVWKQPDQDPSTRMPSWLPPRGPVPTNPAAIQEGPATDQPAPQDGPQTGPAYGQPYGYAPPAGYAPYGYAPYGYAPYGYAPYGAPPTRPYPVPSPDTPAPN